MDSIVGALGLRLEDLYPKSNGATTTKPKTSGKRAWRTLEAAVKAIACTIEPKPIGSQSWTYHDPPGNPIMAVARYDIPGDKTYRPFQSVAGRVVGVWVIRPGCCRCTGCPR